MKTREQILDELLCIVARQTGVTVEEMQSKQRITHIKQARQVYMYVAAKNNLSSLRKIGLRVNRDHSTVSVTKRKLDWEKTSDKALGWDIREVEKEYHLLIEAPEQKKARIKEAAKTEVALKAFIKYLENENASLKEENESLKKTIKELRQCIY